MGKTMNWKSALLNNVLLPVGDFFSNQKVNQYYQFYTESQWWSRTRLIEDQNIRLKEVLKTAYAEVPFYRELYNAANINIDCIVDRNLLSQVPVVSKDQLRKAYPHSCRRNSGMVATEYHTSGSSGQPFTVLVDNDTMSRARALMLLRANYCGWEIGTPALQTGMTLKRGLVKHWKDKLFRITYVSAFDLSDKVLDRYLDIIDDAKLEYIMGYPGSIFFLAQRARSVGFNKNLLGVVSWGDNLYSNYRRTIESTFGCRVTDTYGCGEGIQVAAQCQGDSGGYHIFMPHVLVEIVDACGLPVAAGETGDILLTRLDAGAMPLVRYRVGDIGRMSKSGACSCGRGLEILESIEGRDTDVVVTPRGNRLIVHFFTGIFEYYPSIDTFKIIQEEVESIRVMIVPGLGFEMDQWESIVKEIHEKGDPELKIELDVVDAIPFENSNKRRFVVSKVAQVYS